jgi:hypothetical protein
MSYYTAKVQLIQETEGPKGGTKERKVTETYLVEAMSVTEAEAKVIQEFQGYNFDFEVKAVTASKIVKILE